MTSIKLNKEGFLSKKVLRGLERNALGCAMVEPLWALFGGMIFFYQPLYMKALGFTEVQMGLLNSIAYDIKWIYPFVLSLGIFITSLIISVCIKKKIPNP